MSTTDDNSGTDKDGKDDKAGKPAASPSSEGAAQPKAEPAKPDDTKAAKAADAVKTEPKLDPKRAEAVKAAARAELEQLAKREPPKPKAPEPPEPPPWYTTLRADPPAAIRLALGAGLIALVLGVWWLLTMGTATEAFISPSKLPSPGAVFGAFGKLLDRELTPSIIDTLVRVFLGVALAAIVGVVLGVIAASQRGVNAAIAPLVIFLRSIPMGALLPLTLLLFSDGEKQKWMFIFLAVVPFVFSDTVKAVSIVPERYIETAQTLGASNRQIIMKVLVPLALPDIITSLRFQVGLALGYIMLAEAGSTIVEHGLGQMIALSEKRGLTEHVYLLLFVIALIAFGIDLILRTIQRGAFAWRKDL